MRVVVQRVSKASVSIENAIISSINKGLLILVGIESSDNLEDVSWLAHKVSQLRIFADNSGQMNLSIAEIKADVLVVSQFTLHASYKKGNRPSFLKAARAEIAEGLYESFCTKLGSALNGNIQTGKFGAQMEVYLINDGPVTIIMDTKNKE